MADPVSRIKPIQIYPMNDGRDQIAVVAASDTHKQIERGASSIDSEGVVSVGRMSGLLPKKQKKILAKCADNTPSPSRWHSQGQMEYIML